MSSTTKNKWMQPGFLIVVGILAISAVGWNVAVGHLHLTFHKLRVDPKQELTTVPAQLGDWVQVSKDEPLDKELQATLATDRYIFRDFVNTKLVSPADLAKFDGLGSLERKTLAGQIQALNPDAVIKFGADLLHRRGRNGCPYSRTLLCGRWLSTHRHA